MDLPVGLLIRLSQGPTLRLDSAAAAEGRGGGSRATEQRHDLDIGLLGPIRVVAGGSPIDIGGARAETLLSLLAMRPGTPVSADSLMDALWSGDPPDGASTTLRSYASRLRAALGGVAQIEHVSAGYRLVIPPESVDMTRFEQGVRDGHELLGRGRYRRATDSFRAALALWRGQPFAGLPDSVRFRAEITRLEELRLHALEARLDADLEVGRASEVVEELEVLVAEFPFRERLWQQLMLALYRSGRQADALAAYHRARRALDDELGIEPGAELRDLEAAILRQDVPPAAARRTPLGRLPSPLTTFIGRERELAEIRGRLETARLVTLFGIGGTGKTRLALEIATNAIDRVADGVAFVDLAAVSEPDVVPATVATAIGVERPGHDVLGAIGEHLRGTEVLLVLDNCEHVRDAVATVAERLLSVTSDLRILTTSREVLGVPGEAVYPVPPMSIAPEGADPGSALRSEAVRLLVDRAALARHDLRVTDEAAATAARICRELDGLPLAIELAAARTNVLSLDEIAERLNDRFGFLVAPHRPSSPRHAALAATMDWSYALLAPDEQSMLARLSVFPGGATLSSIAVVCAGDDAALAERLIARLVDASLVLPVAGRSGTRYRLLETVREYAAGRVPADSAEPLRQRHAERMRDIAVGANLSLERSPSGMSFEPVLEELPSIRAAIQWSVEAQPLLAVEIACALELFWTTGRGLEGLEIFDRLLARDELDDVARARALRTRGGAAYSSGEYAAGIADYEAALTVYRRLRQPAYVAHLQLRIGLDAFRLGDHARARSLLAAAAAADVPERFFPDQILAQLLDSHLAFEDGRVEAGFEKLLEAGRLARASGDDWWLTNLQLNVAERAVEFDRREMLAPAARDGLRLARTIDDRHSVIWALAFLAQAASLQGQHDVAGRIWGGIEAEGERGGRSRDFEEAEEVMRARLVTAGGEAFHSGAMAGHGMPIADIIAVAFAET